MQGARNHKESLESGGQGAALGDQSEGLVRSNGASRTDTPPFLSVLGERIALLTGSVILRSYYYFIATATPHGKDTPSRLR